MKKKSIKVNAVLSAVKQSITVLFPLITIPYVSRVLGVENYGKINFGNSIISYFTLLAGLGVSTYAVLEGAKIRENKREFSTFTNEVFSTNLITTFISYLLLGIVLIGSSSLENYKVLLWVQAIPMLFITLGTDWINTVFEDYFYITIRYIVIQAVSLICIFLFVKNGSDYIMYALILGGAQILGNIVNYIYIRKKYISIKFTLKMNFRIHIKPLLILFANSLAISVYVNADITMLTIFVGDIATGIYSISVKIYTIVKQVIASIIGVLLPRVSFYLGNGMVEKYNHLLEKAIHALFIGILPIIVGIYMLRSSIVSVIAGTEYVVGSSALGILSMAIGAALFSNLLVYAILIPNREERFVLKSTIIAAISNIILNMIVIPKFSYVGAAVTTLVAEYLVLALSIKKCVGKCNVKVSIKSLLPCIGAMVGVFVVCSIGNALFSQGIINIIFCGVISAFIYILLLLLLKDKLIMELTVGLINKVRKNDNK